VSVFKSSPQHALKRSRKVGEGRLPARANVTHAASHWGYPIRASENPRHLPASSYFRGPIDHDTRVAVAKRMTPRTRLRYSALVSRDPGPGTYPAIAPASWTRTAEKLASSRDWHTPCLVLGDVPKKCHPRPRTDQRRDRRAAGCARASQGATSKGDASLEARRLRSRRSTGTVEPIRPLLRPRRKTRRREARLRTGHLAPRARRTMRDRGVNPPTRARRGERRAADWLCSPELEEPGGVESPRLPSEPDVNDSGHQETNEESP